MRLSDYDGIYFKVIRDGEFENLGLSQKKLPKASLGYATAENYLRTACNNENISCIICPEDMAENSQLLESGKGIAICETPAVTFILLHNDLVKNKKGYVREYEDTQIGEGCQIHPTASIASKGVIIGENVIIEEFAVIRAGCQIGNNVIIRAGVVIGADNYDICRDSDGQIVKMQESGQVYIADDVEIGWYSIIARGSLPYETTMIGKGTCIDAKVMISHNCKIGNHCLIITNVHICGSTIVEDGVRINPMATIKNNVTIGKNAVISFGAVVAGNVSEGSRVTGNFAIEHSKFLADYLRKIRK